MNREKLNSYRVIVRLIQKDEIRLDNLKRRKPTAVFGKAKGSSRNFPYTERSFMVNGAYELNGNKNYEDEIKNLTYKIQSNVDKHIEDKLEVENFIESIADPVAKEIFIELYLNGRKQEEIAREINMERSNLSKIVSKYVSD